MGRSASSKASYRDPKLELEGGATGVCSLHSYVAHALPISYPLKFLQVAPSKLEGLVGTPIAKIPVLRFQVPSACIEADAWPSCMATRIPCLGLIFGIEGLEFRLHGSGFSRSLGSCGYNDSQVTP